MRPLLLLLLSASLAVMGKLGAETLPPKPPLYFNDYASVVPPTQAKALNEKLAQFERDTSNQILVAVYPKMESDSSIEDFTVRTAQSWGVGQKGKDNGAVLFAFLQDRKIYLQVGYGLEGAIPDITARSIIREVITPRFKQQDIAGGLSAGIDAIFAATRGEYKGTGRITQERVVGMDLIHLCIFLIAVVGLILVLKGNQTDQWYSSGGYYSSPWSRGWGSSGGGWSSGGGGSSGFSGGGGSFGGGGAGGSW